MAENGSALCFLIILFWNPCLEKLRASCAQGVFQLSRKNAKDAFGFLTEKHAFFSDKNEPFCTISAKCSVTQLTFTLT